MYHYVLIYCMYMCPNKLQNSPLIFEHVVRLFNISVLSFYFTDILKVYCCFFVPVCLLFFLSGAAETETCSILLKACLLMLCWKQVWDESRVDKSEGQLWVFTLIQACNTSAVMLREREQRAGVAKCCPTLNWAQLYLTNTVHQHLHAM